jgi:hypothetical protein
VIFCCFTRQRSGSVVRDRTFWIPAQSKAPLTTACFGSTVATSFPSTSENTERTRAWRSWRDSCDSLGEDFPLWSAKSLWGAAHLLKVDLRQV